jgi:hypothetical protein
MDFPCDYETRDSTSIIRQEMATTQELSQPREADGGREPSAKWTVAQSRVMVTLHATRSLAAMACMGYYQRSFTQGESP